MGPDLLPILAVFILDLDKFPMHIHHDLGPTPIHNHNQHRLVHDLPQKDMPNPLVQQLS